MARKTQPMYVRLRPYNRLSGDIRITYTAPWATTYHQGVWHEMQMGGAEQTQAIEYLRSVRQHANDPHSRPAFDICTYAESLALIEREKMSGVAQLEVDDENRPVAPTSITSKPAKDLNRPEPTHELEMRQRQAEASEPPKPKGRKPRSKQAETNQAPTADESTPSISSSRAKAKASKRKPRSGT